MFHIALPAIPDGASRFKQTLHFITHRLPVQTTSDAGAFLHDMQYRLVMLGFGGGA